MKKSTMTAMDCPPPPLKGSRKTLIAVIVIVVIVAVAAGVYFATRSIGGGPSPSVTPTPTPSAALTPTPSPTATATSSGGGASVAAASSLQYSVTITNSSGAIVGAQTYYVKNIGTSNLMVREEYTWSGRNYTYIINGVLQKVWSAMNGKWKDLSSQFASEWSGYNLVVTDHKDHLASWSGIGDYTYLSGGSTVRIYNISVNPSLPDSLFEPS